MRMLERDRSNHSRKKIVKNTKNENYHTTERMRMNGPESKR